MIYFYEVSGRGLRANDLPSILLGGLVERHHANILVGS